jgi:hypothetical protein
MNPRQSQRSQLAIVFGLFIVVGVVTVALQSADGAYRAELGSLQPDEAPHYVNGLLIERYVLQALGHSPMAFAKNFYMHFPKVSIGHWPPMFYLFEAAWMLLFTETRTSIVLFSAVLTTALATLLGVFVARRSGRVAGLAVALIFVLLPTVRLNTAGLMLDVSVAGLDLLAAYVYARYLTQPSWRPAALFGVLASAAALTKGNGLALALLPALAILLSGRFELLKRFSFWLPAIIVTVICGPWYIATYALAHDGFVYTFGLAYTRMAAGVNGANLLQLAGALGCALAGLAVVRVLTDKRRMAPDELAWRCGFASLLLAVLLFQVVVPTDVDKRYLVPAIPPLMLLAVLGLGDLTQLIASRLAKAKDSDPQPDPARLSVMIAVGLTLLVIAPVLPPMLRVEAKPRIGMIGAARTVIDGAGDNTTALIASDSGGEGAFIVEMAANGQGRKDPARDFIVARGSKLLASADFLMIQYRARFSEAAALAAEVERLGIHYVVVDTSQRSQRFLHDRLVWDAARLRGWTQVGRFPHSGRGVDGETLVYRLQSQRPATSEAMASIACVWQPRSAGDPGGALGSVQMKKPFNSCD